MEDSSSKNKICIKIKMPTTAAATPEAQGDGGSGGGDDFQQLKPGQLGYRVCEFCGKKFDNGKAWGGHKRHHLKILKNNNKRNQEVNTDIKKHKNDGGGVEGGSKIVGRCNMIKAGDVRMSSDGKPTCCLCGEIFDSFNSLFSHMRFHPDRDRKGIYPPTSSSGIDKICSASVSTAKESSDNSIDLLSSLSGWGKRDKRGRSFTSDIPQAAQSLLTLSRDITTQESAGHQQETSGSATKSFRRVLGSDKILGFDSNQNYGLLVNHKNKKMELENEEVDGNDGVVADEIPESEAEEEEEEDDDDDEQVRPPMENIFQCDICEKTYPTGQALGGHKRSHWKAPGKSLLNEDANHSAASNVAFKTPSSCGEPEGIQATHGMLNIDLNKPYVMQEDGEESFSDESDD